MDTLYGYIIWIHTKCKYTSAIIITTIRSYHFQLIYYSIRVDSLYLYRTVLRVLLMFSPQIPMMLFIAGFHF